MRKKSLSNLECHVLAHLHKSGPMSAYRLRQLYAESPTDALAASAGSIYPLVARLESRGYIGADELEDGRGTRLLRCSAQGVRAVRGWLRDAGESGALSEDGMRSRAYFFDALTAPQRAQWLEKSLSACEAKLAEIETFASAHQEGIGAQWAHDHARRVMQARIEWLKARMREHEEGEDQ